ncbi:MAG: conjugal transfer protein TraX [Clostridiales bacterium]|nr:conjugal transfer protein TraX [Clostridiales bacterium]
MSSFIFKIIAIISMLCDHIGICISNNITYLRCIGRLSLPIFAWQLSIGADKTKNIWKYLFRLFIFSIISQPFYMLLKNDLLHSSTIQFNIGFTLFLGLICIIALKKDIKLGITITIIIAFIAEKINIEYGWYGILMIVIFYIFKNNKVLLLIAQLVNFLAYYYIMPIWQQGISLLSVIAIILLYNEKKGINAKYLFYVFYPLHMLILYLVFKLI